MNGKPYLIDVKRLVDVKRQTETAQDRITSRCSNI